MVKHFFSICHLLLLDTSNRFFLPTTTTGSSPHQSHRLDFILTCFTQTCQKQFQEAFETACVLRSLLVHEQSQLQDPPLIKREFYERFIELCDHGVQKIRSRRAVNVADSVYRNYP
ncbi:MAG: hypothetical protein FWE95_08600 [Planctomycetaceae bacterium]|nr:hypothetical protein [Planctomycetaceae bacterium]